MAFLSRGIGKIRVDRDSALGNSDKDEVSRKEAEFQAMLDNMLNESRENIAKRGINMDSAEAMLAALEEAKNLNLTDPVDEQKAFEEFSTSFVDFIDSMVEVDDDGSGDKEPDMLDQSSAITNSVRDTDKIDNLSLEDALKIVKSLNMSQQDYNEAVEILNDVEPNEISDIVDFMVRARSRGQDMDM